MGKEHERSISGMFPFCIKKYYVSFGDGPTENIVDMTWHTSNC